MNPLHLHISTFFRFVVCIVRPLRCFGFVILHVCIIAAVVIKPPWLVFAALYVLMPPVYLVICISVLHDR